MNPNVQVRTVALAANQTVTIDVSGNFLLLASNSGTFKFSIDGGPLQPG